VFAVFGQEVLTPPISEGCLPGITREVLLEIQAPGISVVERALSIEDLYRADEVFITSTTRGLLPVTEIAGRVLTERSAVREPLLRAFEAFLTQDIARRKNVTVNV
jgi:branched-subunit amino acid aminotransferase/4-amino-4-deoxychorismate lyase